MLTTLLSVQLISSQSLNRTLGPMVQDFRCSVRVFDERGQAVEGHRGLRGLRGQCSAVIGPLLTRGPERPTFLISRCTSPVDGGSHPCSPNVSRKGSAGKSRKIIHGLGRTPNFTCRIPHTDRLQVSMRGAAPDTMSLHSLRRPLVSQRPTAVMASSSGLGPLSQWQLTGENYIDSEQRKRHRGLLASRRNEDHFVGSPTKENRRLMYSCGPLGGTWETTHSGHTSPDSPGSVGSSSPNSLASSSSMADVEKPLRKPREERSTVFDRTVRIPRKKLVLDGPLYATSYAHWNSQVFPPPPANMANGSSD